jgi:hypothetical protein
LQQLQQHHHHVHHHHHSHLCQEIDRHSQCELDLSSPLSTSQTQLLSPPPGDSCWLRKASLPGSQGGNGAGSLGGPDNLLRRGSLPLTPASGAPLLHSHPPQHQHRCFHLPTSDYFSSSNPSVTSGCSNPSYLMRRSSSGSITLAPLREGSSTDITNEDSMSQVEQNKN